MKKEGKVLTIIFLASVLLILSVNLVSANLFTDIGDFFKKLFIGGEDKNLEGELGTISPLEACTPNCTGKVCGSDGCSGSCGNCTTGYLCDATGQCIQQTEKKLIAYYPFEGNANDASVNGNNGTVYGAILTTGKTGQGYSFDGVNDYISTFNKSFSSMTVCAWAKSVGASSTAGQAIVSTSIWTGFYMYYVVGSGVRFGVNNGKETGFYNEATPSNWHYYCGVYNGTNVSLYDDAILRKTAGGASGATANSLIKIGYGIGGSSGYFNGTIDEVKIWNYALSTQEILDEYNRGNICTPNCTGKTCGDNGCGGSCGTCQSGQVCQNGSCVSSTNQTNITYDKWCNGADVNRDGKVNSQDVTIVRNSFTGFGPGCNLYNGWCNRTDVNRDGKVNSGDVTIVQNSFTGFGGPCYGCYDQCNYSQKRCSQNYIQTCNYTEDICLNWFNGSYCNLGCNDSSFQCIKCIDSDGGKNYFVKGTVVSSAGNYTDLCYQFSKTNLSKKDAIVEYYCDSSGNAKGEWYNCTNGCSNGVCNLNMSLSAATLKDSYSINEQIKLTDPPDNINTISGRVVDNNKVEDSINSISNIRTIDSFDNNDDNLKLTRYADVKGNFVSVDSINKEIPKSKGYIVEFEDKPLVIKDKELKDEVEKIKKMSPINPLKYVYMIAGPKEKDIPKKLSDYRKEIEIKRDKIKNEILNELGKNKINSPITGNVVSDSNPENLNVLNEYENVFNGIALDVTSEEAEEIKKISGVKSVSPNLEVKANLMDSVPLIGADKVWQLDEDGNQCAQTGKECLTGKNVTIAIIDTGIDYTHEEFCNDSEDLIKPVYPEKLSIDSLNKKLYWVDDSLRKIISFDYLNNKTNVAINERIYGGSHALAVDNIHNKIYWLRCSTPDCSFSQPIIVMSNIDGTNPIEIYHYTESAILNDIELDLRNNKVYWLEQITGGDIDTTIYYYKIKRANLDGSNIEEIYSFSNISRIIDMSINTNSNQIYFADINNGEIKRYNIDNRLFETILTEDKIQVRSIIVNNENNLIYYGITGAIKKANLDGGNREAIVYNGWQNIIDLKHDSIKNKLYWIQENKVFSVNVDGSNLENVFDSFQSKCFGCDDCKVIGGYDFVNDDNDPMDDMGHGTHVAGIAAGNGVLKGVAPDAKLYAYKVLNSGGSGSFDQVIAGIERAVDPNQDGDFSDHVDVMSMSLGADCTGRPPWQYVSFCGPEDAISNAVNNAVDAGIVSVIAAGNSGPLLNSIGSPGTAKKAITVGATDKKDNIADFSSKGPVLYYKESLIKPDVVAPGISICSSQYDSAWNEYKCFDDKHIAISGTSMATPHVAGLAALIKQKNKNLKPEEIKSILKKSSIDLKIPSYVQGFGRINSSKAVFSTKPLVVELNTSGIFKGVINISGKVLGKNLSNYILRYGEGINPKEWVNINQGNSEINGLITTLDTFQLKDRKYLLSFLGKDNFGNEYEDRNLIKVNNNPAYRKILNSRYEIDNSLFWFWFSPFVTGDIDGDNQEEIIVTRSSLKENINALIEAYEINGSIVNGWPIEVDSFFNLFGKVPGQPILGDLNKDGINEVILLSGFTLYAWHGNGTLVNGFPVNVKNGDIPHWVYSSIGDVDGDLKNEIIFISLEDNTQIKTPLKSRLFIIGSNGEKKVNKTVSLNSGFSYTYPSLADIDKDGKKDIVIYQLGRDDNSFLNVLNSSGDSLQGWPISFRNSRIYNSPLIADLDKDGDPEIVSLIFSFYSEGLSNIVVNPEFNISSFGIYILITNKSGGIEKSIALPFSGGWDSDWQLSLGDINNDNLVEIIARAGNNLAIIRNNGIVLKYKEISSYSPTYSIIGNIDGENKQEIIIWDRDELKILNESLDEDNFISIDSFSIIGGISLSNLDKNGKLDLVGITSLGEIFIFMNLANYTESSLNWPQFQHDPQHTGCYDCEIPISQRPQSKLVNNKNFSVSGNLNMILQVKKENGNFIDEKVVVNTTITIPALGLIKLDTGKDNLGNQVFAGWNNLNVTASSAGDYRVYAKFESSGKVVEAVWEFKVQ